VLSLVLCSFREFQQKNYKAFIESMILFILLYLAKTKELKLIITDLMV